MFLLARDHLSFPELLAEGLEPHKSQIADFETAEGGCVNSTGGWVPKLVRSMPKALYGSIFPADTS